MTNKPEALKPCPFCGGEAKSYFNPSCDCCGHISGTTYCGSCSAEIGHRKTEAEAITAWNTRASTAPVEGEALASLVERLNALHVWPQAVADYHADTLLPRQTKGLYEVGKVATEAATTITTLAAERDALREALRSCRRAVGAGKNNPRQTVRNIVDMAIDERDRCQALERTAP